MVPPRDKTPRPELQVSEHPAECRQALKFKVLDDERQSMNETLGRLQTEVKDLQEYRTQMGGTAVDVVAFQARLDQHLRITAEYITELARSAEVLGATTTIIGQHETLIGDLQTAKLESDKQAMYIKGGVAVITVIGGLIVSLVMHSYSAEAKVAAMEAENNIRKAIEIHVDKYHDEHVHKPTKQP